MQKRDVLKVQLEVNQPSRVRGRCAKQADKRAITARNLTEFPNLPVLQTIRSEVKILTAKICKYLTHVSLQLNRLGGKTNLWGQVSILAERFDREVLGNYFNGYIQSSSKDPFKIFLIAEECLTTMRMLMEQDPKLTIFFDSTGKSESLFVNQQFSVGLIYNYIFQFLVI